MTGNERAAAARAVGAFILVMSLGIGYALISADPCPDGAVHEQERGLAVLKAELPPGALYRSHLNECDSGDPPFFTVYTRGSDDPVQGLLAARKSEWTPIPPEPSDPERRGSIAQQPFEEGVLSVGSGPYLPDGEPLDAYSKAGVAWYMTVTVWDPDERAGP